MLDTLKAECIGSIERETDTSKTELKEFAPWPILRKKRF